MAASFPCGLCWIIFEIIQKPRVLKRVNSQWKRLYSQHHRELSEGTVKMQMVAYESGFLEKTLAPGVRGKMVLCMRFFI